MADLQIIGFILVLAEAILLFLVPKKWVLPLTIVTIFTIVITLMLK